MWLIIGDQGEAIQENSPRYGFDGEGHFEGGIVILVSSLHDSCTWYNASISTYATTVSQTMPYPEQIRDYKLNLFINLSSTLTIRDRGHFSVRDPSSTSLTSPEESWHGDNRPMSTVDTVVLNFSSFHPSKPSSPSHYHAQP